MTIRGLISTLSQQEDLNFLLTNRIPRAALTRFVGWFSKIEHPPDPRPVDRLLAAVLRSRSFRSAQDKLHEPARLLYARTASGSAPARP